MAVQRAVAERWKQVTGKPLIEGYGLTETSPIATVNPLTIEDYTGAIGLPMPSTDIAIRDIEGRDVPFGEAGRALHQGAAGDGRLLDEAGRDGPGDDRGRLSEDRRHRPDRRARLHLHRRPEEGHDPRLRLQRLSERDRGRGDDPSGRARGRRDRRAGRQVGRGGQDRGRAQGRRRHRRRDHRPLPPASHRLQDAASCRVPRDAAALADRQDPAPRAEGWGRAEGQPSQDTAEGGRSKPGANRAQRSRKRGKRGTRAGGAGRRASGRRERDRG